jgi:hypothetical protein
LPKILPPPEVAVHEATKEERAGLRTPALTKKVTWNYPETKYVIYSRPDIAIVPGDHEERRAKFPDIYNLIEYDRQRQGVARTVRYAEVVRARGEEGK